MSNALTPEETDREIAKACASVTSWSLADWEPVARAWRIAGHDPDRLRDWVVDNARNGSHASPELVATAIGSMEAQVPSAKPTPKSKPPTGRLERAMQQLVVVAVALALAAIALAFAWRAIVWVLP